MSRIPHPVAVFAVVLAVIAVIGAAPVAQAQGSGSKGGHGSAHKAGESGNKDSLHKDEGSGHRGSARKAEDEKPIKGDAYPLEVCPVSGEKLGSMGDPVTLKHEGREVRFCCAGCEPAFRKDPRTYLQKIDEAIVEQQRPFYPLDTCIVSGEKLGSMGDPVEYVYRNRLVRFCCAGCKPLFEKNARENLGKLNRAVIDAQKEAYPLDTCVVSGDALGEMGDPVDFVHANRLVRFCCTGCEAPFRKEPAKYMGALDAALKAK